MCAVRLLAAGITLLLSMTVFQMIIADKVPESSQAIPLIGLPNYWKFYFALKQFEKTDVPTLK